MDATLSVMAGLVPAIHVFTAASETWMPGTSSAKTRFALSPGHDGGEIDGQEILAVARGRTEAPCRIVPLRRLRRVSPEIAQDQREGRPRQGKGGEDHRGQS